MIYKILTIILVAAVIITWGFFSFYNTEKIINKPDDKIKTEALDNKIVPEVKAIAQNLLPDNQNNENKNLNMLFFGDLMLDRHVGEKIKKYGLDYLFVKLDNNGQWVFNGRDLISANLEGAVTDGGQHYKPDNAYDFAFAPKLIDKLKKYNFNFFNIANNHLADQGENGIIETRKNLNNSGFSFSGCKDGAVNECSYKVYKVKNYNVGFVGFSLVYNVKKFDIKKASAIVSDMASSTDLVIVNIHWGIEYEHQFNKTQQEIAHKLIDAGVDMIIGHHPHVVQGFELYKNKPIFYSLGNFIFDQYFSSDTQEELAVGIDYIEKCVSIPPISPQPSPCEGEEELMITLLPMRSKGSQPELMSVTDKEKFLEKYIEWSEINDEIKKEIREGKIVRTTD
jgi:gamma-polyglutamate biosynthesis protein CapA